MSVIELNRVSKCYRLGAARNSLREAIMSKAESAVQRRNGGDQSLFWAVKDVSFTIEQGETVGIIGHNGAGKSTMLKLLSRVTYPTQGCVHTHGRMAALIELGAGFHPDLSGRDNVYLNGSILGLKKQEIDAQMDSIVAFAELEKFIDTPVKRYSSGMYVRLAFAVAAHVKADILLVDEVLSVGDSAFQDRSLHRMRELQKAGTTIVFISHHLSAVQSFCSRVLVMDHGQLVAQGAPAEMIKTYEHLQREAVLNAQRARLSDTDGAGYTNDPVDGAMGYIKSIELSNGEGVLTDEFHVDDSLRVRCEYIVRDQLLVLEPTFGMRICRESDNLVCTERFTNDLSIRRLQSRGNFEATIKQLGLMPGAYRLEMSIMGSYYGGLTHMNISRSFTVVDDVGRDNGVVRQDIEWVL